MAIKFKNNASGTLKTGIAAGTTAIELTTGHGDRFPAVADPNYFYATFEDDDGNKEIVKVTARTAGQDTMTIVRAQESTSAQAWVALDVFEQRVTAGVYEDIFEDIITNAAAIAALGTMSAQDADAVAVTGGTIDDVTFTGITLDATEITATGAEINTSSDGATAKNKHQHNTTLFIPHAAFGAPRNSPDDAILNTNKIICGHGVLASRKYYAPVYLPDGVTITQMTLYGYRTSSADLIVILYRSGTSASASACFTCAGNWTDGSGSVVDSGVAAAGRDLIDTDTYAYHLELELDVISDHEESGLYGVKIAYATA